MMSCLVIWFVYRSRGDSHNMDPPHNMDTHPGAKTLGDRLDTTAAWNENILKNTNEKHLSGCARPVSSEEAWACFLKFRSYFSIFLFYVFWWVLLCWISTSCGRWCMFIWIFTLSIRILVVLVNVWSLKWIWCQVELDHSVTLIWTPFEILIWTLSILGSTLSILWSRSNNLCDTFHIEKFEGWVVTLSDRLHYSNYVGLYDKYCRVPILYVQACGTYEVWL